MRNALRLNVKVVCNIPYTIVLHRTHTFILFLLLLVWDLWGRKLKNRYFIHLLDIKHKRNLIDCGQQSVKFLHHKIENIYEATLSSSVSSFSLPAPRSPIREMLELISGRITSSMKCFLLNYLTVGCCRRDKIWNQCSGSALRRGFSSRTCFLPWIALFMSTPTSFFSGENHIISVAFQRWHLPYMYCKKYYGNMKWKLKFMTTLLSCQFNLRIIL